MSEPSFTPGPWEAHPSCCGVSWGWYVLGPPEGDYRDAQFEKEADARLIAAAPALYAACKAVCIACGSHEIWRGATSDFLVLCEAALALADGETT